MNLNSYCNPHTKIISGWITDINLKGNTRNCLKENIKISSVFWIRQRFLQLDTKIIIRKRKKTDEMNLIRISDFY
jgi:hypothetical protein